MTFQAIVKAQKFALLIISVCLTFFISTYFFLDTTKLKEKNYLNIPFPIGKELPQPTKVQTVLDYFFLVQISSGLIHFDGSHYQPAIAKSWSIEDKMITFSLREDAKFSDGSPISTKDIETSFKRIIIERTSTHYPLWDYLAGCDKVKSYDDQCEGIQILSENQILFKLSRPTQSFFVLLSSPETGIWAKDDILKSKKQNPIKFSGAYFWHGFEDNYHVLRANPHHWSFSDQTIESVHFVQIKSGETVRAYFEQFDSDVYFSNKLPFDPIDEPENLDKTYTRPMIIHYLQKATTHSKGKINSPFLENFWSRLPEGVNSAETFLFTRDSVNLSKEDYLSYVGNSSTAHLRLGILKPFYGDGFCKLLVETGKASGIDISIVEINIQEFKDRHTGEGEKIQNIDFILVPYAASENFAAIQLRYMTPKHYKLPDAVKYAESLTYDTAVVELLKQYQKSLLNDQVVMPLFFSKAVYYHRKNISLSHMSSEGLLELWNIRLKK